MKLPRDVSAKSLSAALTKLDYRVTRQAGSHLRFTKGAVHHVTIPNHDSIKVGTLNAILREVAEQNQLSREDLLQLLFS